MVSSQLLRITGYKRIILRVTETLFFYSFQGLLSKTQEVQEIIVKNFIRNCNFSSAVTVFGITTDFKRPS